MDSVTRNQKTPIAYSKTLHFSDGTVCGTTSLHSSCGENEDVFVIRFMSIELNANYHLRGKQIVALVNVLLIH